MISKRPLKSMPPDIYFILIDGYPSSGFQEETLGVMKNELDTYLSNQSFFLLKNSTSNYRETIFSMASEFNLNYLDFLKGKKYSNPYLYNKAEAMVEQGIVFDNFQKLGYHMINLSIFNLPGLPSIKKERFMLTPGNELILYNTLYKRFQRDVIPGLVAGLGGGEKLNENMLGGMNEYNQKILDSIGKMSNIQLSKNPVFLYVHLLMPHFPYYYDSTGKPYPEKEIYGAEMVTNPDRFKNYIGYTNKKVISILDRLKKYDKGHTIYIIQSDHGSKVPGLKKDAFRNYSAFYFPDKDYSLLYQNMSNVNTFRIIFNKYFGQQLPLLPDSIIYTQQD